MGEKLTSKRLAGGFALSEKKVTVCMRVSVHPIKAALWHRRNDIKPGMSLRVIGAMIGVDSPQLIKHHLDAMVKMGSINYVSGNYEFPIEF